MATPLVWMSADVTTASRARRSPSQGQVSDDGQLTVSSHVRSMVLAEISGQGQLNDN